MWGDLVHISCTKDISFPSKIRSELQEEGTSQCCREPTGFCCTWHLIQLPDPMGMSLSKMRRVITKYFNLRLECFGVTYKMSSAGTFTKVFCPCPWFMFTTLLASFLFITKREREKKKNKYTKTILHEVPLPFSKKI